MNERSLDHVTKEVLYYALLLMVHQHFANLDGHMWDHCITADEYAGDLIDKIFDWDGTEAQLNAEIERMKDILIDRGIRTY